MKILIIGASGQVGKELYHYLSSQNENAVTGTSRNSHPGLLKFDPFKDDWSSLGKFDVVINSVGAIYPTLEFPFEKIHGQLTALIVKNLSLMGDPRVIQISVLGAEENSEIAFLRTKAIADNLLLKQKNTFILRPSIICTHRTMLIQKILFLIKAAKIFGFVILPKGFLDHKIQPILIQDLSMMIENLCKVDYPENIIPLVGPEEISFRNLIEFALEKSTKKIKLIEINRRLIEFFVKNFLNTFFPRLLSYDQFRLLFADNTADVNHATILLGRNPASAKKIWKDELGFPVNKKTTHS